MSAVLDWAPVSARPDAVDAPEFQPEELEQYRKELTGYCYRMLGSAFEADDAVQETMVRAWRGHRPLRGPLDACARGSTASPPTCASTCCAAAQRRARPMDLGPSSTAEAFRGPTCSPSTRGCSRIPDARVIPATAIPPTWPRRASPSGSRSSPRCSTCPPRQRAVLILREVLRWQATEVAELLDTTRRVGQQRAAAGPGHARRARRRRADRPPLDADQQALLARYVDAFERYDITALVALLHDDAVMSMPPYDFWLRGADQMVEWFVGTGIGCQRLASRRDDGQRVPGLRLLPPSTPRAGGRRGRSRCSKSQAGGSSATTTSSTPRCSPPFGLPDHLGPDHVGETDEVE